MLEQLLHSGVEGRILTLAEHRRTQGLRTLVVDVEDVYDEFAYGIRDADAIWSLLHYAHEHWQGAPRYVVLAGEGSFDYKDYLGHGDSIIPTLGASGAISGVMGAYLVLFPRNLVNVLFFPGKVLG